MNRVDIRLSKLELLAGAIFILAGTLLFSVAVKNYLSFFESSMSLSTILGTAISGLVYISLIYAFTGTAFGAALHAFLRRRYSASLRAQKLQAAIERHTLSKKAEVGEQRAREAKSLELVSK